jgi:hypothetical protein
MQDQTVSGFSSLSTHTHTHHFVFIMLVQLTNFIKGDSMFESGKLVEILDEYHNVELGYAVAKAIFPVRLVVFSSIEGGNHGSHTHISLLTY